MKKKRKSEAGDELRPEFGLKVESGVSMPNGIGLGQPSPISAGRGEGICKRRSAAQGQERGLLGSGSVSPKLVEATLCGCPFGGQARRPAFTPMRR